MLRRLILTCTGLVLMFGVVATPVAAVDPEPARVTLLNGLPARLDICFGTTEAVSNLRYGRAVFWEGVEPGAYRFVVRAASQGACTGRRLGTFIRTFAEAGNSTLVIWKPFRRLLMKQFENDTSLASGDRPTLVVRHTARQPPLSDVWVWEHVKLAPAALEPTLDDLRRGRSSPPIEIREGQFYIDMYANRRMRAFIWAGFQGLAPFGTTTELYLIGTALRNYRIVAIQQDAQIVGP